MPGDTSNTDPIVLSLSNIPDGILPAFSPVERSIVLVCRVLTGKTTLEQAKEMLNGNRRT